MKKEQKKFGETNPFVHPKEGYTNTVGNDGWPFDEKDYDTEEKDNER